MTVADWGWLTGITAVGLLIFHIAYRYEKRHRMPGPPVRNTDDD